MDYDRFLSERGRATQPGQQMKLRNIYQRNKETMISLTRGMPNDKLFPFKSADIKLQNGETLHLGEVQTSLAMQYSSPQGLPDFVEQLKEHLFHFHKPPIPTTELCVTHGNTGGLWNAFELFMSPADTIIVEDPTYHDTLDALGSFKCNIVGIANDNEGMRTDCLKEVLTKWTPEEVNDSNFPKIIYIVPSCGNPSGVSMSMARRIELYEIAHEYNLLILEDDPYHFLQFDEKPLPSLLSMDVDGRVLRFDTFSKVFSAGLRVGFVSGPKELIGKFITINALSRSHISGFAQIMISNLLKEMGLNKFENHVEGVKEFYREQKRYALKAAEKYLTGLAEWNEPSGGMFLWIKILGISDTKAMIEERAEDKQVILYPGCYFSPDTNRPSCHLRASYSLVNEEQLDEGFKRLRDLIMAELKLRVES